MKPGAPNIKEVPLAIVGSNRYGRYPKISVEETYNMIISDGFLVPFAGYKRVLEIDNTGEGRGIYASNKLNIMIVVIDDDVYELDENFIKKHIGNIASFTGDVFIKENNSNQFLISDQDQLYLYERTTSAFNQVTDPNIVGIKPGQIGFQDDRFIVPDLNSNEWYLSAVGDGASWPADNEASLRTKPDTVQGTLPIPGAGNNLFVFGQTVTELWQDVGGAIFPYQRSSTTNLDYGCANAATIAESDNLVCWLAQNEKSGFSIMVSQGRMPERISNDGIDFRLAELSNPTDSYGFLFKQDGHLIYVLNFPSDNFTICFDFNTKKFFSLSDENFNFFNAKRVVFFNDTYYFVSLSDGNLYELSSKFTTYDYGTQDYIIPRGRMTAPYRNPDQSRFIAAYAGFTIETGNSDDLQKYQLAASRDGGVTFGNFITQEFNTLGKRQNKLVFWRLGMANDLTLQFRFYGRDRFVVTNGVLGLRQ